MNVHLVRWPSQAVENVRWPSKAVEKVPVDRSTALEGHRTWAWLLAVCLTVFLSGCGEPNGISTAYGRRGGDGASSVNGTGVLSRMFRSAGHRVVSRGKGSGRIDDCEVVIWAPDRFTPPTSTERDEIQTWLGEKSGRTFVYIGRDYDAGIEYWQQTIASPNLDPAKGEEYRRRLAEEMSRYESRRSSIPEEENASWFVARRDFPRRQVREVSGPWSDNFDAQAADIWLRARSDAPSTDEQSEASDVEAEAEAELDEYVDAWDEWSEWEEKIDVAELHYEVLLAAESADEESAALVTRVTHPYWLDSEIVIVANGSFLLNLPLVNHEHRRLAGELIDECGDEPMKVAFWDADTFEPRETAEQHDQWSVINTWPLNFILLHLGVLGIIFVLWRFPIFGPAKDLPPTATSDFAKHIDALGELMSATKETGYARGKLQAYRTNVRGEGRDGPSV